MTIQIDNVDNSISAVGTDTNIAIDLQPKGTGALNVAAGSSGVNISNGGTVTAITGTAGGSYTTVPTITISAPTTAGGVQATGTAAMAQLTTVIAGGGTGYTVSDVLTFVGGTGTTLTATVTAVSAGVITAFSVNNSGTYTVLPTNPISVTGGTGSGATFNVTAWQVRSNGFTITNAGSGYVEQPTVTFSSGSAAAYVVVGSQTIVKSLGTTTGTITNQSMMFQTPAGNSLLLRDSNQATPDAHLMVQSTANGYALVLAEGSNANASMYVGAKGSGSVRFSTLSSSIVEQMRVAHTASAVNYVQVTGAVTASQPTILAQGSDTNVGLILSTKGASSLQFRTNTSNNVQFFITHTVNAVNYLSVTGGATGAAPALSAQGADTNIDLTLTPKGTGVVAVVPSAGWVSGQVARINLGDAGSNLKSTASTGKATLSGFDGVEISSRGNSPILQLNVPHTASAVNYVQATGAATGAAVQISAQGSDTNIPLVLQPKGTGALQAQRTDSTTTGGNARGANAVDWQTNRVSSATRVASGQYTTLSGGNNNSATGYASATSGGEGNQTTGVYGNIGGGFGNTVSGYSSVSAGGYLNTSAGFFNFIGGGFTNSGTSGSAVTTQSGTMNGTTAVTLSASNASIKVGQLVSGTSIASFTYVAAISGTSLTLSQAASGSSTSTLSFFTPFGTVVGGGNNQATGSYSFIGGGGDAGTAANRNVASGDFSVVVGGARNTASGTGSFVGGGGFNGSAFAANTASGTISTIAGGIGNTASGVGTGILGGFGNIASSTYSSVLGGTQATTRGIIGNMVASGSNAPIASSSGVSQFAILVLGRETTDATATALCSNTSAAGTTNQVILPNNSAYYFRGEIISGVTGGGDTKGFFIEGVIKRGANAASTALVGTPTVTSNYADAGASTWTIAVTADTTNGGLAVTFTGQASTTIRTVAQIRTTEMTY